MSTLLYFAYGSNLHPQWLRSRTPSAEVLGRASAPGFTLQFNKHGLDNSGKCNIVQSAHSDALVHGVIYRFASAEKALLDEAERGYEEQRLQLGRYEDVLVYVAEEMINDAARPYSWYQDIVVAGALHHAFPQAYVDHIRSFSAMPDPDRERERRQRAIAWPEQKPPRG